MNPQAQQLNIVIGKENHHIFEMLSGKGKEIFFPAKGILGQSKDAKGKRINATIGMAMEDDGSPMGLKTISDLVQMAPEEIFPYAPSSGVPELWNEMLVRKNPSLGGASYSMPVVCNALTHGLHTCGFLFVDPVDEIILPDLYWGNYNLVFRHSYHAELTTFPMFDGEGFNVRGLQNRVMTEGEKKVVILNFPNNPTGYSPSRAEVGLICKVLYDAAELGKRIVVICDDAYFGLVFEEGIYRESVFAALANLHERILAVKIDGAKEEDYAWGFRVGFITYGNPLMTEACARALENKTSGAIRASISSGPTLSQSLILRAYRSVSYEREKQEKSLMIEARYRKLRSEYEQHPEYAEFLIPLPFNSGYFMCFRLMKGDAEAVRQILLRDYDTGIIALDGIIRIAYSALSKERIPELLGNIYQACRGQVVK